MDQANHHFCLVALKTNGEAGQGPSKKNDPGQASAPAEVATDSAGAAPVMDTPAAKNGTANSGSSKKKAAVPEHKSKKLNKKKPRPLTNLDGE